MSVDGAAAAAAGEGGVVVVVPADREHAATTKSNPAALGAAAESRERKAENISLSLPARENSMDFVSDSHELNRRALELVEVRSHRPAVDRDRLAVHSELVGLACDCDEELHVMLIPWAPARRPSRRVPSAETCRR